MRKGHALRRQLDSEVVVRRQTAGASDYVFVVNDHREFGDYVGQHGLVLDNGLPSDTTLTLHRTGHVYDLTHSREVRADAESGALCWPVSLGPCGGGVFLVTPEPIAELRVAVPESVVRGASAKCSLTVVGADGTPISAVVPMRVDIADPAGRLAEFSGYYGARDGRIDLGLDIATNDSTGVWTLHARDLASGLEATRFFRVKP